MDAKPQLYDVTWDSPTAAWCRSRPSGKARSESCFSKAPALPQAREDQMRKLQNRVHKCCVRLRSARDNRIVARRRNGRTASAEFSYPLIASCESSVFVCRTAEIAGYEERVQHLVPAVVESDFVLAGFIGAFDVIGHFGPQQAMDCASGPQQRVACSAGTAIAAMSKLATALAECPMMTIHVP